MPVGQATDERTPLLSLFVTRAAEVARREWIAWTSQGPYDASSPLADEYLGWHFNPEKRSDPVAFARADKYRDTYFKRGILDHVVRTGNATDALREFESRLPVMGVMIDGGGPSAPRRAAGPFVRTRALTLRLDLAPPFPLDRVTTVSWQLDDGLWHDLGAPRRYWAVDLAPLDWGRGPHVARVRLVADNGSRQFDWTAGFHYLPEPPRIDLPAEWLKRTFPNESAGLTATTRQAAFRLEARMGPGTPGETVRATVRLNDDPPLEVGQEVAQDINLREGENRIEVRAVNAGAGKDSEDDESAVQLLRVQYYRERPAPRFEFRVQTLTKDTEPASVYTGLPIVVSSPKVRVLGRASGEENLAAVTRGGRPVPGFIARRQKQINFQEDVDLTPGEQALRYEGRTPNSPMGRETLRIIYRPPVARIQAVRPVNKSRVYERQVEIRAELAPVSAGEAYSAEVLVNGRVFVTRPMVASSAALTAQIELKPGMNPVAIRLHNLWGTTALRELQLYYARPPVVRAVDAIRETDKAVIDVKATVDSPLDLPPCLAQINGVDYGNDRLLVERIDALADRWRVTVHDVGLQEGENTLSIVIANRDDESRARARSPCGSRGQGRPNP